MGKLRRDTEEVRPCGASVDEALSGAYLEAEKAYKACENSIKSLENAVGKMEADFAEAKVAVANDMEVSSAALLAAQGRGLSHPRQNNGPGVPPLQDILDQELKVLPKTSSQRDLLVYRIASWSSNFFRIALSSSSRFWKIFLISRLIHAETPSLCRSACEILKREDIIAASFALSR